MKKSKTSESSRLMARALKLLNIRPRSIEELRKMLLEREFPLEEVNQVISQLIQLKYLDDVNYIESWCYYRQHISPKGRWLVRKELVMKGVSAFDLDEHFDAFYSEEDEKKCLQILIEKKSIKRRLEQSKNYEKEYQKVVAQMVRKGFNLHQVLENLDRFQSINLDIFPEKE
ncbi:MAG: regulatory protein RecX [Dehalobacterium sp.]|jgi:SOS response regulatory protein OraA/RecX